MSFLAVPPKSPLILKPVIYIAERIVGKPLPLARLLALRPALAFVSALLEIAVEGALKIIPRRLGAIVRLTASFRAACPFCVDLNSAGYEKNALTLEDISVLQTACADQGALENFENIKLPGFKADERAAWAYALAASSSPLYFPQTVIDEMKKYFSPRKIVTLAGAAAKVNYWARLSQALGISAIGVSDFCFTTTKEE